MLNLTVSYPLITYGGVLINAIVIIAESSPAGPSRQLFLMVMNHKHTRPARIVLAEDDRAIAHLIEIAMKRTGIPHDLETVHDGHQAIDALEKKSAVGYRTPDLLLLDLHMPGKNGFEVLQYVKGHSRLQRIPVVMFSNSSLADDVTKAYELHVNAFVQKNTDFADLCRTADAILRFWLQTAILSF
jgi:chemotaxis family two-component system response regulator Rcp1